MIERRRLFSALLPVLLVAASVAAQDSAEESSVRTWELNHAKPSEVRLMLTDLLGDDSGVRIVADNEKKRLVVMGSTSTLQLTQQLIERVDRPPRTPDDSRVPVTRRNAVAPLQSRDAEAPAAPEPTLRDRKADPASRLTVRFRHITAKQCEQALKKLLGSSLRTTGEGTLRYRSRSGSQARLTFDQAAETCELAGNELLVNQLAALLRGFEQSQDKSTKATVRFVPLRNVDPDVLNRAIRVWKRTSRLKKTTNGPQSARRPDDPFRTAGMTQVEADNVPAADPDSSDSENTDELRPPATDINIQPLPDLDAIILEGRDADVEEIIRIIQEIERLSEETAPEIEVYYLQHVQGLALRTLVDDVLSDLTRPLQGRVSITPLVTPNALLLIGWGEAVDAAKKLIAELDQPLKAEADMRIFALEHAPASEVANTIEQFLDGRGGLSPDANVTANARTNSVIVNASPRDMEEVARLIDHLDAQSAASVNQGKLIRLKNSSAARIAETIREAIQAASGDGSGRSAALEMMLIQPDGEEIVASGLLSDVRLTPDTGTNTILITGPEVSLALVERLIEQLDRSPASEALIKVFEIAKGDASDMVQILRTLFPASSEVSTVPQLPTADGDEDSEGSLVPVRFSVDIRSNSIIATGSASDLRVVEALLLRLDEADSQERVNRVYRLKNSPATDVARAVNDFLRSERIVTQAAPGRQNPFEQIEQEVVVVPEPVRNTLIVSATPRYIDQIMELIRELDDQPPQVVVQVILAEVDLDNFHEFGVELGLQDSLLFDRSLLGELLTTVSSAQSSTPAGIVTSTTETIVGADNEPGFDFNNNPLGNSGSDRSLATSGNVGGQALSHFSLGRVNSELDYGGLVLSASSENVSVLLRALNETGSMEIISRPQITTLDNQTAYIQVGERVPLVASSSLTQFGQVNTVENEDVGILLLVTPRINSDGNVVMEIDAEKSDVGPEREGIPISVSPDGTILRSPRVNVARATTTVSAASGQTIVIGGLITTDNSTLSRKVPWLGDLPVLGNLFRYDGYSNSRKELLIILTPQVIRGRADMEYLKQVEMARMSWVCSDVFEFLDANATGHGVMDDTGVPVFYPDESPIPQGRPTADPQFRPRPDSPEILIPDVPGEPRAARPTTSSKVSRADWQDDELDASRDSEESGVIQAGRVQVRKSKKAAERERSSRTLFGRLWGTDE